jgi:NADH-quinone oxidoreductase subunit J
VETLQTPDLLKILALIVLGATGTYLLLPHRHGLARPRLAHQVGFGLTTLAILAFTLLWKAHGVETVSKVFFYLFAFSAVGGAVLTITSRDPIHSALWFAAVVLATSGLFLLAGAQFLAAGTIIVYAGAIIVTFLFVIMLAQKEGRAVYDRMARSPFGATFASFLLLFGLVYAVVSLRVPAGNVSRLSVSGEHVIGMSNSGVVSMNDRLTPPRKMRPEQSLVLDRALPHPTSTLPEVAAGRRSAAGHVAGLGGTLYTDHLVTVELAGALLFAALIGVIAIATPKTPVRPSTSDAAPRA